MSKVVIFLILFFIILHFYNKWFSPIPFYTETFITGGVKSRKSFTSVFLAIKRYRRSLFFYKIKHIFNKKLEKPLLYSNMPLSVPYVPITNELLLRQERPRYGSTVLIDEASLVADSQLIKNQYINSQLLLFTKLFGHETLGGNLIVNTHNIEDLHYSFKRCCVQQIYILKTIEIPFFIIIKYRILTNVPDVVNVNDDFESVSKMCLIPKKYHKYYDSCYLSSLTDSLPVSDNVVSDNNLKQDFISSFRDFGGLLKNEKK